MELIEGLIELRGHIQAGLPHSTQSDRQKLSINEEMQGMAALGCEHSSLLCQDQMCHPKYATLAMDYFKLKAIEIP